MKRRMCRSILNLLYMSMFCVFASPSGLSVTYHNKAVSNEINELVEASNPLIWSDVPDPSVIRVGDTYYMSSTTMHMNPGLPIMKSKDLVNWTLINYAHQEISDHPALDLENGQNAYGQGSWASSIRFVDGIWYVNTFSHTTNETYIYKTTDIENGPWETYVINPAYHDSALFFENGKAYLAYGIDDIRIIELKPDGSGVLTGGLNQVIIQDASAIAGSSFYVAAEGTHLQKINGWYYISLICWPRGGMRTQLVYRSRSLTGPYEGRIVLQDRGIAQGGFIDTPEGNWYAFLFRDSGSVGRIPYLVPVSWQDGWPVLGQDGTVPETLGFMVENNGLNGIVSSDNFSHSDLGMMWQWNHNPNAEGWSLNERPGFLRLRNRRVDNNFVQTKNTLTQRSFGPQSSAIVKMEFSQMMDGDYAGLGALQANYGFVAVRKDGWETALVMVEGSSDGMYEISRLTLYQDYIYLKISMDFRNRIDQASFSYSYDGINWQSIGSTLQMSYTLPHFMGYRFALFNFGTKSIGGYVDFDYFQISD